MAAVAVAAPGVRLTRVNVGVQCASCELLCVRVTSASSFCVAVVIYRTGSVTLTFVAELSDILDRVSTLIQPIYIVGDINIYLDRPDDPDTVKFNDILAAHGLTCRVTSPTHCHGRTLDVVATHEDLPSPPVAVVDVGLSDHRLLRWTTSMAKPSPVYMTCTCQPRLLDADEFRAALMLSPLCRPDTCTDCNVDDLAQLYHSETSAILDQLAPARLVTCRQRPTHRSVESGRACGTSHRRHCCCRVDS